MDKEKGMERLLPKVKKTVDSVYEYLIPHPDGCGMSAKEYGRRGARVCSSLVNRKIIEKTNLGRGEYKYKWVATMGPTQALYRSIALEIQTEEREYYAKSKKKTSAPRAEDVPVAVVETAEEKSAVEQVREMWERMQALGVIIENNQLVLVSKTVLS